MSQYSYFFRRFSVIILHIYDYKCVLCEIQKPNLEVHHIDKNIKNNSGVNLVPLCKNCHSAIHKNILVDFSEIVNSKAESLAKFNLFKRLHNE